MPDPFGNKHLQFISIPLQMTIVAPTYMSLQQATTSDHHQPLQFCQVCAWYSACLVSSLAFNGGCARGMFISPLIFETHRSAPVLRQCAESRKRYCDLLQYHYHPIIRVDMQGFRWDLENTLEMDHSLDWCDVVFCV